MSRLKKEQKDTLVGEIIKTDFALQNAMEEAGMEARTYGIWGFSGGFSESGAPVKNAW